VCLVSDTGVGHGFGLDCWLVAKQYVLKVDIFWSADQGSVARELAKDSTQVMRLINKRLALTPQ